MPGTLGIGILIHQNSEWLGSRLVDLSDEALSAHEDREYPLAVVKAGACLEGLLELLLHSWHLPPEGASTLGPLIGAVRKSNRAPGELLERFNEASNIRNRASHNKPLSLSQVTEGDSLQILNILGLIVGWYSEQLRPSIERSAAPDLLPVFLSVGGPHRLDQQQFLQRLRSAMRGIGVDLRKLAPGEYSKEKPLDQVQEMMASCRAALIVGLERSHAYAVFERERSDGERVYQDQYIPTAWNQLEGSIASALRLPLLILRERRLHKEGIFEAENHRHRIRDFDVAVESKRLSSDLCDFLAGWVHDIRSQPRSPAPGGTQP